MEDPDVEWEIQENSCLEESEGKVSWILDKGLWLGKKIVITGVVLSSAPLILPPLLVVTALGFAFSLPAGLVFVSYAFTEKLMSKLLPMPRSHSMLEYGTVPTDEEYGYDEVGFGGEAVIEEEKEQRYYTMGDDEMRIDHSWKGGDNYEQEPTEDEDGSIVGVGYEEDVGSGAVVVMDEEEKEQSEDTTRGVEMRIELDEEGGEYGRKDVKKDEVELKQSVDQSEEKGYEKDVEDEEPLEDTNVIFEGAREEGEQEPLVEEIMGESPLNELHQVVVVVKRDDKNNSCVRGKEELVVMAKRTIEETRFQEEEDEFERETTGLLKNIRDDGNVNNSAKKDERRVTEMSEIGEGKDGRNVKSIEELEKPFDNRNEKLDKLIEDIGGTEGGKRDETVFADNQGSAEEKEKPFGDENVKLERLVGGMKETDGEKGNGKTEEMQASTSKESVGHVAEEIKQGCEKENSQRSRNVENVHSTAVVGKPTMERHGRSLGGVSEKPEIKEEEVQKPIVNVKEEMQKKRVENCIARDVHEDHNLETNKENLDARNLADGSHFNAADAKNSYTAYQNSEENEKATDSTMDRSAAVLEFPVSAGVSEAKNDEIVTKADAAVPSHEASLSEERIWEQIEAMRTIVGYQAALHSACVDEVKALFFFTGVEPPSSFKDPTDLVEVNEKLRFLMSIVGVK